MNGTWRSILVGVLVGAALPGCDGDTGDGREAVAVVGVFGEAGISPGQMTFPRAIDTDGDRVWVIDKSAHVQRIDPRTGAVEVFFAMPEWSAGKPCGITVGPPSAGWGRPGESGARDVVYVADTHYHRIVVFASPAGSWPVDQRPEVVAEFGRFGTGLGEFVYPTDVAVLTDKRGLATRLYVSEYGDNDRVTAFDAATLQPLFAFGALGSSASADRIEFSRPQSIAVDAGRGRLVVADACNHRVGVFTLDGALVRWIGSPESAGVGRDQLGYPYGLVLLEDGSALVSELGNARVKRVDLESGRAVAVWGGPGRVEGTLSQPWSLALVDRVAWVLDSGNDRVQGWRLGGVPRALGWGPRGRDDVGGGDR